MVHHAAGFRHGHGRHERSGRHERAGSDPDDPPTSSGDRPALVRRRVVGQRLVVRRRHRVGCAYGHGHPHPHEDRHVHGHAHQHPHGHERRNGRRSDVDPVAHLSDRLSYEHCPDHPHGHRPDRADDRTDLARTDLDQAHRQQRAAAE
ncbi:hypothetical protein O1M63_53540 [Streptomyces mirabilis]|nr:hypothetical protein [Streptomyces mirabilis]